ncbi:response regulator [uncultured Oscillibacter sp.]|uniref:response regulator n=1 Tax=uncultured Oscillibacter sp. TaxID=876091 RepID=UPI00262B05C4|nr:response regulator [uncultured Oscillibacter sp.]
MIENHGLIEYLLRDGENLSNRESLTARQIKRFTDEMPGGFFIYRNDNGQVLYANRAILQMFGCETEEEFQDLTGGTFLGMVHPGDVEDVEASIREQIQQNSFDLDYVEYRIVRKDGSICWVEDFGHFIETKELGGVFYVFLADITERHRRRAAERAAILEEKFQKERELQEQADQTLDFLEQMNDELVRRLELIEGLSADYETVFHADLEADVIQPYRVSGRECFQFGRDLQVRPFTGFAGGYAARWVHPEDRERFRREVDPAYIREALGKQKSYHINYRILRQGEPEYVQAFIVNVSPDEEATQIMFACRTVDEEVRRERERSAILEEALAQAKLAGDARNTFLSNISHDMRTPMNAVVGFAALAKRHIGFPERLKKDLERIEASSAQLLSLLNNVLELSWLESGQIHIEEAACCLPELAREVWEEILPQAEERGVELVLSNLGTEHPKVWCDRQKLRQSLERLALGAVRRVEKGGRVELFLQERSATRAYGSYHFTARCSAMASSFDDRVFAAFSRREITAAADAAGADLGLPIAKHVMELMGGRVDAQALPDGGGLLTASLNLRLQEEAEARAVPLPEGDRRVLVVEDNELNREIAVDLLEEADFLVETAENGAEAVEKVKNSCPGYYALVLMDLRMPVMDGHSAARAIRALEDPGLANVPIVALSANTFDEDRKQSAESGMNAHLAKPLDIDRLLDLIDGMTENKA